MENRSRSGAHLVRQGGMAKPFKTPAINVVNVVGPKSEEFVGVIATSGKSR